MKAMVCEMCGGHDLVKQDGMYVCQHCGTKYSTEEAKKLLIEISGSITIDRTKEFENYMTLAERAFGSDYVDAKKNYAKALEIEPNNWKAYFGSGVCDTYICKYGEIAHVAQAFCDTVRHTFELILTSELTNEQKLDAVKTVIDRANIVQMKLTNASIELMMANGQGKINEQADFWTKQIYLHTVADFQKQYGNVEYIMVPYGIGVLKAAINSNRFPSTDFLVEAIRKYEPDFNIPAKASPAKKTGGCYVATAVYGSYDCPQVWTLRRFRDYSLAKTWYGRAFIRTYYAISPTLVKWFGKAEWFKNMWKPTLDRMVNRLNSEGVENTPYNDRNW